MTVRKVEDVPEYSHWCFLLIRFVSCNGKCSMCSVEYLRSRFSVVGGC